MLADVSPCLVEQMSQGCESEVAASTANQEPQKEGNGSLDPGVQNIEFAHRRQCCDYLPLSLIPELRGWGNLGCRRDGASLSVRDTACGCFIHVAAAMRTPSAGPENSWDCPSYQGGN
jgi:hypothetical protein